MLRKKYQTRRASRKGAHSRVWTAITKGELICNRGSKWIIGSNSSLSLWQSKWLNAGCLRSLIEGPLNRGEDNLLVRDTMVDGHWNLTCLSFELPEIIKNTILATPLHRFSDCDDLRSWVSNISGNFDQKNAYLLAIGEEDAPDFEGKWIWKLKILPKIQIFLWKCLHHTLPVKGILSDRGIEGLGGCDSCPEVRESILHVLRECPVAQRF